MNLKELIKTFSRHEKEAEKARQKDVREFLKNNPGAKLPDWIKDDFNLSSALKLMCEEILDIKLKLGMK